MRVLIISLMAMLAAGSVMARPWNREVMYFAMTDRFHDGDASNNVPEGSDPKLYDARQRKLACYMGGDLRGLEKAIDAGYFNDLGVTALWITPVVRNVWRSGFDQGGWKSGYHGYWTQDWLDIDPHLTSATSMSGKAYPEGVEGRMEHYRDFVNLAHSKGLRVIQDVVLNHAGPVFYYDTNGNGKFDFNHENEWVRPYQSQGFYAETGWIDIPEWNVKRPGPEGPRELLGVEIPTTGILGNIDIYSRKGFSSGSLGKSDGEEVDCDFFSLRDIYTSDDGKYFDAVVDEFVAIYHFYLNHLGVDGLRVDTVKHVHHEFWDAFTSRLRKRLGDKAADKLLFGEVYDGNPAVLGSYTWRDDSAQDNGPCLDAVLDFDFCFSSREYLRHAGDAYGSAAALQRALTVRASMDPEKARPFYNPNPGPDGLNAQQKMITFIENHDGINRFRVDGVTERRNRIAQALVMALPGIPCLYYGTEMAIHDKDGKVGQDAETGRMMLFRSKNGPVMRDVRQSAAFREIRQMADLRKQLSALTCGKITPLWVDSPEGREDDGVFVYALDDRDSCAVVVVNASSKARVTEAGDHALTLPDALGGPNYGLRPVAVVGGGQLEDDSVTFPANGPLKLPVPESSLVVYKRVPLHDQAAEILKANEAR